MRKTSILLAAILGVTFTNVSRLPAASTTDTSANESAGENETLIEFEGQLQTGDNTPVSGLFPLTFRLHDGPRSKKATWQTTKFVAVDNGSYQVTFGNGKSLTKEVLRADTWISVRLGDGPEILRDRLVLKGNAKQSESTAAASGSRRQKPSPTRIQPTTETEKLLEQAQDSKEITFANIADRALKADHAETAETAKSVGDLTAEDIKKKSEVALDKLGEHITDPQAHSAAGGINLGDQKEVLKQVGGSGGKDFELSCPPNHVVTGIKGGYGNLIDRLTVICTPLK
jgi:hypothetical protein